MKYETCAASAAHVALLVKFERVTSQYVYVGGLLFRIYNGNEYYELASDTV